MYGTHSEVLSWSDDYDLHMKLMERNGNLNSSSVTIMGELLFMNL